MADAININGVTNLPAESTLLINYSITETGLWDLHQLYTAYRNVCDDVWTVMYPNYQHPLHSDFPISVVRPVFNGTFAWNYGGIRGITSENFDDNHSYLTQITIYNLNCSGVGGGGIIISGSPTITGNPTDGGTRTGNPEPRPRPRPQPPRGPEPPTITPPGIISPRLPLDNPTNTGNPEPRRPRPDPINPGLPDLGNRPRYRVTGEPIGPGFRENSPGYSSRPGFEINNGNYIQPPRRTRGTISPIETIAVGGGTNPIIIDRGGRMIDSETRLEVGSDTVVYGQNIISSGMFRVFSSTATVRARITTIDTSGNTNVVADSGFLNARPNYAVSLSAVIDSTRFISSCVICITVEDSDGTVVGSDCKTVVIIPQEDDLQARNPINANEIPELLRNHADISLNNYIDLEFYQNQTRSINISARTGYPTTAQMVLISDTQQDFTLSMYNSSTLPSTLEITTSDRMRINNRIVFPKAHNVYAKGTASNASSYNIRISPRGNNSDYHYSKLYLSRHWLKQTPEVTFSDITATTATVTLSCAYGTEYVKLIVNGYERGRYTSESYTQEKTTSDLGEVSYSAVPILRGQWVSLVLRQRGRYNISTNLIHEAKHT